MSKQTESDEKQMLSCLNCGNLVPLKRWQSKQDQSVFYESLSRRRYPKVHGRIVSPISSMQWRCSGTWADTDGNSGLKLSQRPR